MKNQTRSVLAFALFAVVIISSSFTPSPYQEGTIVSFPTVGLSDITPLDSDEADWDDEVTLVWELVTLAPDQVPESGAATHRVYAQLNSPSHSMIAVFGTQESPISISTTTSFFQHEFGGNMATDINTALYEIEPDLASDSWVTLGSEPSSDDPNSLYSAGLDWSSFGAGASLTSDPGFGGAWFVLPSESIVTPDSQGRVLLAQLTSTGEIEFNVNLKYSTAEGDNVELTGLSISIPGEIVGFGCGDELACNYQPSLPPGGVCDYNDAIGICGGTCTSDADDDGVCDSDEIAGCTDPAWDNFNPAATDDDGSCANSVPGVDLDSLVYEWVAGGAAGTGDMGLSAYNTYRVYAQFSAPFSSVTSIFGDANHPLSLSCEGQIYQAMSGGPLANAVPYDSWWAISNSDEPVAPSSVGIDYTSFESGGDLLVNDIFGGAIYLTPGVQPDAMAGADGRVLLGQFSVNGPCSLTLNLHYSNPGEAPQDRFGLVLDFPSSWSGCMDATACNFNSSDSPEACVYATDLYGEAYYDCDGVCLNDSDGDGVCDEAEVAGCTYDQACNYNSEATDDDASCIFAEDLYYCDGSCLNDLNDNGVCDEIEVRGCTYEQAANFDENAAFDDGSCVLASCIPASISCQADLDSNGDVGMMDLLVFLSVYTNPCQ